MLGVVLRLVEDTSKKVHVKSGRTGVVEGTKDWLWKDWCGRKERKIKWQKGNYNFFPWVCPVPCTTGVGGAGVFSPCSSSRAVEEGLPATLLVVEPLSQRLHWCLEHGSFSKLLLSSKRGGFKNQCQCFFVFVILRCTWHTTLSVSLSLQVLTFKILNCLEFSIRLCHSGYSDFEYINDCKNPKPTHTILTEN